MPALFGAHRFHLASAVIMLTLTPAAFAEVFIRLDGIPERVAFPFPPGANQLLTATITGGPVESVWLEPDPIQPSQPRIPFARIGPGEYTLNLADAEVYEALKPFGQSGQIQVCAKLTDGAIERSVPLSYSMREQSDIPDDAKLTIYQRDSWDLPSPEGNVRISLGDITHGQVIVTIRKEGCKVFQGPRSMHVNDSMEITVAGTRYRLRLEELNNLLVGSDFAVFSLMPAKAEITDVESLLQVITQSGATFIRNGQEVSADASAEFLRQKLARSDNPNRSVSEFIDQIATRSSTSGKPYQVKLPAGTVHELGPWLRQQAGIIENPITLPSNQAPVRFPSNTPPPAATIPRPFNLAPVKQIPEMDRVSFERFLGAVEQSGATFLCDDMKLWSSTEFARLLQPWIANPSTDFTAFVEFYALLMGSSAAYEVELPNGSRVNAGSWLREQAVAALKPTNSPKP